MRFMIESTNRWVQTAAVVLLAVALVSCEKTPEEPTDPIPNIPVPTNLSAIIGGDGITLSWEFDSSYDYSGFDVLRSEDDQVTWFLQATVPGPPFVDDNLRAGFTYWYRVAGVSQDGIRGKRSAPFPTRPAVFEVIIEGGMERTKLQTVLLSFTAPAFTQNVRFSEDSVLTSAQWRVFAPSYPYTLSVGDELKVVYAQFIDEAGNLTESVNSSIALDTFAEIADLWFDPVQSPTNTITPGGTVFFSVETTGAETGGFCEIYIEGMGATPLEVYDDGNNGDDPAGDGKFQRDFTFPLSFRQASMRMSSVYIDLVQNVSVEREFDDNLYMSDPPEAVELREVTGLTADSIALRWTRSVDNHFVSYKIYRDTDLPVDPKTSVLAGTVSNISTTVFTDTGLQADKEYHYQVFVVNDLDEGAGSNEESFSTTP
ncbi:MAG: fibronectin type III domain-containing protein [Candidatus Krumholzibacteria bacterium]|nr:fibronectin type III domain-containing protein [Candidatus Krumholzibacteria bacterium]